MVKAELFHETYPHFRRSRFFPKVILYLLAVLAHSSALHAQSCETDPTYPSQAFYFNASAGFEYESGVRCSADILPVGQTHAIVKYWLVYNDDSAFDSLNYYTLKVRINGVVVQTIADHKLVTASDFAGVTPTCTPSEFNGEECLYEKQFQTVIAFPGLSETAQNQIEVVFEASTSDQSAHEGILVDGAIHYNFRLAIEQVNSLFIPRDANDPAAKCDMAENVGHCYPTINTRLLRRSPMNGEPDVSGRIRFRLVFPKPHLVGNSSNNGSETTPDYEINPAFDENANGSGSAQEFSQFRASGGIQADGSYMVETVGDDYTAASVKITSRDFGGRARVHSEFVLSDETVVPSDIVVDADLNEVEKPACLSSQSDFKFATLPYDQDCDDIADAWERSPTASVSPGVGQIANSEDDDELGPGGAAEGDGFTAHDEYRGFHFIVRDGENVSEQWNRTDPVHVKNVYYYDPESSTEFKFSTPISALLAIEHPKFAFLEVNFQQANAINGPISSSALSVGALARNSLNNPYGSSTPTLALVFLQRTIGGDEMGDAQTSRNDGIPILVDKSAVDASATLNTQNKEFLLALVVAHEVGHKFGLAHPLRESCGKFNTSCSFENTYSNLSQLTGAQYTMDGDEATRFYTRLQSLYDGLTKFRADQSIILNNLDTPYLATSQFISLPDSQFYFDVWRCTTPVSLVPETFRVKTWITSGKLMDWRPDRRNKVFGSSHYAADDLENVCVKYACLIN